MGQQLESFLLGKSLTRSLRYFGYAVVLMALSFGQLYLAGNLDTGGVSGLYTSPLGATVLASVLAGVHTYRNDGILVGIAVAVVVTNGAALYSVISLVHPRPTYRLGTGVGTAIMYGMPIGITAFTIACVVRRYAPSLSSVGSKEV